MAYMTDASGVLGALQTELATKNSTSKKAGKDLTTDDFFGADVRYVPKPGY